MGNGTLIRYFLHTVTIFNTLDEDSLSPKYIDEYCQYQHGGITVTRNQQCTGLVVQLIHS